MKLLYTRFLNLLEEVYLIYLLSACQHYFLVVMQANQITVWQLSVYIFRDSPFVYLNGHFCGKLNISTKVAFGVPKVFLYHILPW